MIVRCLKLEKGSGSSDDWVEVGRDYVVLAIEFGRTKKHYRLYIEHEPDTPALFDASRFAIVDGRIPEGWAANMSPTGYYEIGPAAWMTSDFWDSFFDGHPDATRVFERERDALLEKHPEMNTR